MGKEIPSSAPEELATEQSPEEVQTLELHSSTRPDFGHYPGMPATPEEDLGGKKILEILQSLESPHPDPELLKDPKEKEVNVFEEDIQRSSTASLLRLSLINDDVTLLLYEWYGRGRETDCQEEEEISERCKKLLVQYNSRLTAGIANRYRGLGLYFDDLFQEGSIGLIRAVEKFDLERGVKFSTYATYWIEQAIERALHKRARGIRLPDHVYEKLSKIHHAQDELEQELGREPTIEEIAGRIKMSCEVVERTLKRSNVAVSLNEPIGEDGESEIGDFIEDKSVEPLEKQIDKNLLRSVIWELMQEILTPREAKILEMRFGLTDGQPHTLEEIARAFSVGQDSDGEGDGHEGRRRHTTLTRERVRQIQEKALSKLRQNSRAKQFSDFFLS